MSFDYDAVWIPDLFNSNIALIDNVKERKLDFLAHLKDKFDMKFIIGECDQQIYMEKQINGLFFKNFKIMDDMFSLKDLFKSNLIKKRKLFLITKLDNIIDSKTFKDLLIHGNQYGCTLIIMDGLNGKNNKLKSIKLNINYLVGDFSVENIQKSYELYFTKFPSLHDIKFHINRVRRFSGSEYILLIKNGRRYLSTAEKFKYFEFQFQNNELYIDFENVNEKEILNRIKENKWIIKICI